MSEWTISGNVTIPDVAFGARIRYIGSNNSGDSTVVPSGNFSFNYDDVNGVMFYLIFELLGDFAAPMPDYQPIIHGPYDSTVVGVLVGGEP